MKALKQLHNDLVDIYGYKLQVQAAIACWRKELERPLATGQTTPSHSLLFGPGDPNLPDAKFQYQATLGNLMAASDRSGINFIIHFRCILVLVVATWEDRCRELIARECNKAKNDIKSDVFHDLNKYRQGILHVDNRLDEKPKVLPYLNVGDEISLTSEQMDSIFRELINELNRLGREYYDTDPDFSFDKRLYG